MDGRDLLFTILICSTVGHTQPHHGESCKPSDGTRIIACSVLRGEQLGESPKLCCVDTHFRVVCCPTDSAPLNSPVTTPTTRRSRRQVAYNRRRSRMRHQVTPTAFNFQVDNSTVAGKKCWEYGRYAYVERWTFGIRPEKVRVPDCHQTVKTLITGGVETREKEFPHMAALGYELDKKISYNCGGSLISERYILTAGHCLSDRRGVKVTWARLGDRNIHSSADDTESVQILRVVKWIKHPEYKPPAYYNDIALIKLESDVELSPAVRPICLYTKLSNPVGLTKATATGWGHLGANRDDGSDILMKVNLRFPQHDRCNDSYRFLVRIGTRLKVGITPRNMICAGDPNGKKDTCNGDSGGPLQFLTSQPFCTYTVIGVTAFGATACGVGNTPSVYTRVSNYVPWIEGIVWPEEQGSPHERIAFE